MRIIPNCLSRSALRGALVSLAAAGMLAMSGAAPVLANTTTFLNSLWSDAQSRGVSRSTFDAAFAGFTPSQRVIGLTQSQPEFAQTTQDYLDRRVSAARISTGQSRAAEWAQTLANIESRWGVQAEVVLSIWGMETNFGGYMGDENTIHALATLAYDGYRDPFFRNELLTALVILNEGHIAPQNMIGSWAGAMGHTQFMPSSFRAYAVDYTGDGRRDIWTSIPDALASTANYLREHGWRSGETWGYEVRLPQGFDYARGWDIGTQSVANWVAMGVQRVNGRDFPRSGDRARLFMPAGATGPVFLLLPNFEVIKRYNNSDNYALSVGHLADRILGTGPFVQPWPANDAALTRAQRGELQALLNQRGYNAGTADGIVGPQTRAAIMAFQRAAGLVPDGYPSAAVLSRLR